MLQGKPSSSHCFLSGLKLNKLISCINSTTLLESPVAAAVNDGKVDAVVEIDTLAVVDCWDRCCWDFSSKVKKKMMRPDTLSFALLALHTKVAYGWFNNNFKIIDKISALFFNENYEFDHSLNPVFNH